MHRFLIEPGSVTNNEVILSKKESHHAFSVLRLKDGDGVEVFDGKGKSFTGKISRTPEGRLCVRINSEKTSQVLPVQITLAMSVIKPDRMEWIIEKACELGAARIIPVITDRTVVRLSKERWESKRERWNAIAESTCKQCGLTRLPSIDAAVSFKEVVKEIKRHDVSLIPHLGEKTKNIQEALSPDARSVLLFVGPEGDFTDEEVKAAQNSGATAVTLGPLVLRSETAALYAIAAVNSIYLCRLTI